MVVMALFKYPKFSQLLHTYPKIIGNSNIAQVDTVENETDLLLFFWRD